jgi:hypothetical protein
MTTVPTRFAPIIPCFAGLFFQHTWMKTQPIIVVAILVPSFHTVASVLRVPGLAHEPKWAGRKSLTIRPSTRRRRALS